MVNGNNFHVQENPTNIGLPPPESLDELLIKKKKRFGGRRKKNEIENDKINIPCPPKFIRTNDRTLSFGDNSFDADNAAYNLYAFIVRIKDLIMICYMFFFVFLIVSLWSHRWWTLCCIC